MLSGGGADACLVVGRGLLHHSRDTGVYREAGQFHGAGSLNNAWGFVPGEGVGALLIMGGRHLQGLGIPILGRVMGMGEGPGDPT